jgi:hypothetical protein
MRLPKKWVENFRKGVEAELAASLDDDSGERYLEELDDIGFSWRDGKVEHELELLPDDEAGETGPGLRVRVVLRARVEVVSVEVETI